MATKAQKHKIRTKIFSDYFVFMPARKGLRHINFKVTIPAIVVIFLVGQRSLKF